MISHADTAVTYLTIKPESDCRQLQDDLHSLEKWESDWHMEFNPSKYNVVRVTRRRTPFKFQYKLHGKILETVDTTKYLGIYLSHDLRWNDHVNEITTKANKTFELSTPQSPHLLGQIQRTSIQSPSETDCRIQCYCLGPLRSYNVQQVEMVQRRAARWVLGCYNRLDSATDMLSSLNWRSLELRRSDARLCMLYRQSNG